MAIPEPAPLSNELNVRDGPIFSAKQSTQNGSHSDRAASQQFSLLHCLRHSSVYSVE